MVGKPEENGTTLDSSAVVADELLERQLKGIIDQQLHELGFTNLCQKIAHNIVEKVQQIDEEHKEIKQMFSDIGARLDTLLADQENELEQSHLLSPDKKKPRVEDTQSNRAVIVIDDEDDDDPSDKPIKSSVPITTQVPGTPAQVSSSPVLQIPLSPVQQPVTIFEKQNSMIGKPNLPGICVSPQNTANKPSAISQASKSSGNKKIESVISNLKASKINSNVAEPSNLNDLFANNHTPPKSSNSSVSAGTSPLSTVTSTDQNNGASKVLNNQSEEKKLSKLVMPTSKNTENSPNLNTEDCPPELSKPPVKVNTPGDCPPDISSSIFFPNQSPISILTPVVTPLKESDIQEENQSAWSIFTEQKADLDKEVKDDPFMPVLSEDLTMHDSEIDSIDNEMPFVKNSADDLQKESCPDMYAYDSEDGFEEPLKSPVIMQTNTTSKLVTKIKLPEDFVHMDSEDAMSSTESSENSKKSTEQKKSVFQFKAGLKVFAKPDKSDIWYQAETVKEAAGTKKEKKILVHFLYGQKLQQKISLKNVALCNPSVGEELELGCRIVAGRPSDTVNSTISKKYKDINTGTNVNVMFAGVVAEIAGEENKHRYLVFFDDGYAQYLSRNRMFTVLATSKNVWNDVAVDCQEFIKEYLQEYPYRPLVCTKIGNTMQTEWNGSWWKSRVVAIDASLVKILFDIDKRSEWIYRGTTRLEPMYDHFIPTQGKKKKAKMQKEGSYVDEKITHPRFGVCKYSLKDPEGKQQRREWGITSPVLKIQSPKPENPNVMTAGKAELFSKIALSKEKPFGNTETVKMKRSSSVLSSASDSSKHSSDMKRKQKKVKVQSDSESTQSEKDFRDKEDDMISSQEALGVLSALKMSPARSDISVLSHRSLPNLSTVKSSQSSEKLKLRSREVFELLDAAFVRNAREQGASYTSIANHYKSLYPTVGVNRKNIATFCQIHNIHKQTDVSDEERTLKAFLTSKITKKKQSLKASQSDDECFLKKMVLKKSASDKDLSSIYRSSPLSLPTTPPRLIKRGPHKCNEDCIEDNRNLLDQHRLGVYNYLAIPFQLGWKRESSKKQSSYHRDIYYRSPCNRRMRNLIDVTRYLLETKCTNVGIDMFCFQSNISCRNQTQKSKPAIVRIDDLSYGKETCPIVCINEIKDEYPPSVSYISSRIKTDEVSINTDPGFLVCCDCTDNCQDKTKCGCAQLTINSSNTIDNIISPNAGYQYRRLKEHLTTGIYECNQNCSCSHLTCYNRVVQNGIQLRLQVFMTENRGWGLRCVDDIPRGTFICTYAGQVLNEHTANREGMDFGDEYLAELDHIEVVEKAKDGYESDVPELRDHKKVYDDSSDDDSDSDSDSEISVMCISSDMSDSSDEEVVLLDDDGGEEPLSKRKKPDIESDMKQRSCDSTSTSTGSGDQSPASSIVKIDESDVLPCHVPIKRIPSSDLPTNATSSLSDDSSLTDDCSSSTNDGAVTPKYSETEKNFLAVSGTLSTKTTGADTKPVFNKVEPKFSDTKPCSPSTNKLVSENESPKSNIIENESISPEKTKSFKEGESKEEHANTTPIALKPVARKSTGQKAYANKIAGARCLKDELGNLINEDKSSTENIGEKKVDKPKTPSTRLLYDGDNQMYIIDAKSFGNVGRYMNHSCSPNVFVQNVMVDTHDLRFPWVAFFSQQNIPAYTELTWDYNYEIGSVPGKELICKCGSKECKGRLL